MSLTVKKIIERKKIIVGWDTEFNAQRNELYSHQFFTLIGEKNIKHFWEIRDKKKVSWSNFLLEIFSILQNVIENLENYELILVAHYGTAEVGTFTDFKDFLFKGDVKLIGYGKYATYSNLTGLGFFKRVRIIDTMNYEKTSLWKIGEMLNIQKINFKEEIFKVLPELKVAEAQPIEMFGELLQNEKTKPICIDYGLRDAEICFNYTISLVFLTYKHTGKIILKETLPSIAETMFINYLIKIFKTKKAAMEALGYYAVPDKTKGKNKKGKYPYKYILHSNFKKDGEGIFHGGRNQTYFSGITKLPTADLDLISAYTIFLSLIKNVELQRDAQGVILENQYQSYTLQEFLKYLDQISDEEAITLQGNFEGSITTKHSERIGLLMTEVNQSLAEIEEWEGGEHVLILVYLYKYHKNLVDWKALQKTIKTIHLYKTGNQYIFRNFVNEINAERKKHPKGSIENNTCKLIVNSIYGKLAQGLNRTPIRHIITNEQEIKPPSQISNPLLASYVTVGVRILTFEAGHYLCKQKNSLIHLINIITDGCQITVPNYRSIAKIIKAFNNLTFAKKIRTILNKESLWELKHYNPHPNIFIRPRVDFPLTNLLTIIYIKENLTELKIAWPSAFDKHYEPVEGLQILNDILFNEPNRQINRNRLMGYKDVIRSGEFVGTKKVNATINWNIQATKKPLMILDDDHFTGVLLGTFKTRKAIMLNKDYLSKKRNQFIFHQTNNIKKLINLRSGETKEPNRLNEINKVVNDVIYYFKYVIKFNLMYKHLTEIQKKMIPDWAFRRLKKNLKKPCLNEDDFIFKERERWIFYIRRKNRLWCPKAIVGISI